MKLFQKLIAAPALLSLTSGFAVNASEVSFSDLNNYSKSNASVTLASFKSDELVPGDWSYDSLKDLTRSPKFNGNSVSRLEAAAELSNLIAGGEGLMNGAAIDRLSDELGSELAIMKGRVDGLEARVNSIEAGSFSETTTMSGKAEFLLGATDTANDTEEALMFNYHYEVDLNTSFTGEDKLNIEFAAGSATGTNTVAGITDFGEAQDALQIEDVNYTFPVGGWEVSLGESMDASKNWPNACKYTPIVDSMEDCGATRSVDMPGDISFSAGYEFDNGWAVGFGASADDGETNLGAFTTESDDRYGLAFGYEVDSYGFTVAYGNMEDATNNVALWGLTAYWSPEGLGTLSGGFEFGNPEGADNNDTSQWLLGYTTDLGPGEFQIGVGTNGRTVDDAAELMAYEVGYEYPINDSMTIKPFAFVGEVAGDGNDDTTGLGVLTTFKF